MAQINIHLGNVNDANSKMSRYELELADIRRELEILRWKLDKGVMGQLRLEERYQEVLREIRKAAQDMGQIKQHISEDVDAYRKTEETLIKRQKNMDNRFL